MCASSTGVRMTRRRLSVGAELVGGGAHFRVFAPKRQRVDVVIETSATSSRVVRLMREEDGHFSGTADGIGAGVRYRLRLDDGDRLYPDPASRFQPEGPHGPSEVVDPS